MTPQDREPRDYICIDPEVAALRGRLRPLSSDEEDELALHLELCQACRIAQVMDGVLRDAAARRHASLPPRQIRTARVLGVAALLSLLAAFAAASFLRPSLQPRFGAGEQLVERGEAGLLIEAPYEQEVLAPQGAALRWRALPGASHYSLRLLRQGSAETLTVSDLEGTRFPLPPLQRGVYVAELRALPDHLAGSEPVRVAFRSGGWGEFFGYRLRHLPAAALGFLAAALALGSAALSRRLR
jgi:hypothetical protein